MTSLEIFHAGHSSADVIENETYTLDGIPTSGRIGLIFNTSNIVAYHLYKVSWFSVARGH